MCTLIATVAPDTDCPLVVAANRDEALDRPAAPPAWWPGPVPFFAPKDLLAGGTWLGVNALGLFVGVTNRFGVPRDERLSSRGELVTWALSHASAQALHQALARVPSGRTNAFHLFYADRQGAFVTWDDGRRLAQSALAPGLHVVTERSLGGDDRARTERITAHLAQRRGQPMGDGDWQALLRLHDEADPVAGTCVHLPHLGYGTRSSLVLRLPRSVDEKVTFLWAEGRPCEAPYRALNVARP
jgi:uncharacterized protein with NRDE domain